MLREELMLKLFENGMLRYTLRPKSEKVTAASKKFIMRRIMIVTPHPISCE